MSKASDISEMLIVVKEIWESASGFFSEAGLDDLYEVMDKTAFLTSKFLEIGANGEFLDETQKIAEAILNLSNLVIWGVLLFFGFKSLFSYFLSKKVDVPWKFFIRMIVFGVFANASFFICYTGVFLAENCTDYIRSYVGEDKISFSFLEEYSGGEIDSDEEEIDAYTLDSLVTGFIYFSTFVTAVCLGGRYILIKVLMLLSPIFFILGGLKCSEKIFYKWCKCFIVLLFMQIFFCSVLGIFNSLSDGNKLVLQILICSTMLILSKNIFCFLNLCR